MTGNDRYDKARALFLALVMVVSVFGMTVAFAGSAVAETTSMSLSDDIVQDGNEIYVNGTVNANGTVHAFIDEDDAGNYSSGTDANAKVDVENYEEDNSYSITLNAPSESGTYDVYVFQDEGTTDSTIDDNDEGERSTSLTVDGDVPSIEVDNATPTGEVNNPNQEIVVPVSDATTGVENIQVELYHNDDRMGAYELTPDNEPEGLTYENENLTINPGSGNIPSLQDGTTKVYVSATDTAGNNADESFSFEVETGELNTNFDAAKGTNDAVETFVKDAYHNPFDSANELNVYAESEYAVDFDVSLTPPAASEINDSTAELVIDGPGADGEVTADYEASFYSNDTATFSVNTDADDYNFSADGMYTVTISGADSAGNTIAETYSVKVDTTSPTAESVTLPDRITEADFDEIQTVTATFDEPVDPSTVDVELRVDGKVDTTVRDDIGSLDYTDKVDLEFTPKDGGVLDDFENGSAIANVTAGTDVADNSLQTEGQTETTFEVYTQTPEISVSTPDLSEKESDDFGGGVNFSTFVSSMDDDVEATYLIEDTDSSNYVDITDDVENYDTTTLPDGTYDLNVTVEDEYGNTANSKTEFKTDNVVGTVKNSKQPDTISGTVNVTADEGNPLTGDELSDEDLNTPNLFDYDGNNETTPLEDGEELTVEYAIFDPVDGEFFEYNSLDDHTLDTTQYQDALIKFKATVHGAEGGTQSVTQVTEIDNADSVTFKSGETAATGQAYLENADVDNDLVAVVKSDEKLSTLNVKVTNQNYHKDNTTTLEFDNFVPTEKDGDDVRYAAIIPVEYDGEYELTVTEAVNDDDDKTEAEELTGEHSTTLVDTSAPSVDDAELTGQVSVLVGFDQPIETDSFDKSVVSIEDDRVTVEDVHFDVRGIENDAGLVELRVDKEFQTADAPNVTFEKDSVNDAFGSEYSVNSEEEYTEIHTINFDLSSEGLNVISIPAEAGSVPIEDTAFNSEAIDTVWAYDAAEDDWDDSYSPGAQENDLSYLEGGQGYLVKANEETTVEINAQNVPANDRQAFQSQDIYEGWNLIGHYQEGAQSVGQALTYLDTTYDIELGYTSMQVNELQAGQGYWVLSNGEGVHAPVNYGGAASERPAVGNVQVVDDDGVMKNGEEVEITAEVQHDTVIDSVVAKPDTRIANKDVKLTDENDDDRYTGTLTIEFGEDAEPDKKYTVRVEATDVDENLGFASGESPPTDSGLATAQTVTNVDTGVTYNTLTGALSEVKDFETLELSEGTFAEDRDSLTISTDNLALKGQGVDKTNISANVELAGSDIHVEGIDYVANSPTGDVTVTGEGTTLENVGSEGTISIDADSVTVSNSNAKTISVNANSSSISNSEATDSVDVGEKVQSASMSGVKTPQFTGNTGAVEADNPQPADGKVLNVGTLTTYDDIPTAVDSASEDDTIRVGSGTYTLPGSDGTQRTLDVKGLTLEGPNAGINGSSGDRGTEATIEGPLMIGADDVTVDGLEIKDTDANPVSGDLPHYGAVQIAVGGPYGDAADNAMVRNNVIIAGTNSNDNNIGVLYGEGTTAATVTQNLFSEENEAVASAGQGDPEFEEADNTDETTGSL